MYEGRIIEHIEQGKFLCTLCLQDKGTRLHLLSTGNREINLAAKRAFLISKSALDLNRPREELLLQLREADQRREQLKARVNVRELWELVNDEPQSYDHQYLAELAFGDQAGDDHLAALVRALFEDPYHFKLKEGRFLPHSAERVEEIVRQAEEKARREERLNQGGQWLQAVAAGKSPEPPACAAEVLALLKQLTLYGEDAPDYKTGRELLNRAGFSELTAARRLMVRLGVWEEDENLELLRNAVPQEFSAPALAHAEQLLGMRVPSCSREDLRDLDAFTIDGPWTRDFDDALSCRLHDGKIEVGIHIADVAARLEPGSALDREAAERGASLYLPRRQIPMLPVKLSQDLLSLVSEQERPAVSLLAVFTPDGELLEQRLSGSLIRVARRLTYDQVNAELEQEPVFSALHALSQALKAKRSEAGALQLSVPELLIDFDSEGRPVPRLMEQETPSRTMIAELMILFNWLTASACRESGVPILYRTQAEPSERLVPEQGERYLHYVFQQRRKLNPAMVDTQPGAHSGLGHDAYTHATSPIRRYLDLVVQRQVSALLAGDSPPYSREALEEIRLRVEPAVRTLARIKRNRLRYWVLRYLGLNRGRSYEALVLYEMRSKYRVVLLDFLMLAELKRTEAPTLQAGQVVRLEVKRADPWQDELDLRYAGENP